MVALATTATGAATMPTTPIRTIRANRRPTPADPQQETRRMRADGLFAGHGHLVWGHLDVDDWLAHLHAEREQPVTSAPRRSRGRAGIKPQFVTRKRKAA